jgi:hypothetical protein
MGLDHQDRLRADDADRPIAARSRFEPARLKRGSAEVRLAVDYREHGDALV